LESEIVKLQKKIKAEENNEMQSTTFLENNDVAISTASTPEPLEVAD